MKKGDGIQNKNKKHHPLSDEQIDEISLAVKDFRSLTIILIISREK